MRLLAYFFLIILASAQVQPLWAKQPDVHAPQSSPSKRHAPVFQDYEPAPAIWKLEDEDTTIYLFGTFHVLPKKFRWRTEAFDQIVRDVDELIIESRSEDSDRKAMAELSRSLLKSEGRTPLSQQLSPESLEKWKKVLSSAGVSAKTVDKFPLILTLFGLAVQQIEKEGSYYRYGVETVLEAEFHKADKPIGSIEKSIDVLRNLLMVDDSSLISELDQALQDWDGNGKGSSLGFLPSVFASENSGANGVDVFAEEHSWARGEVIDGDEDGWGDDEFSQAIRTVLLTDRNRAWGMWLDERMDRPGNVLVAVGAAHLEGSDSVQVMLAERGFSVERIQ